MLYTIKIEVNNRTIINSNKQLLDLNITHNSDVTLSDKQIRSIIRDILNAYDGLEQLQEDIKEKVESTTKLNKLKS